MATKTGKKSKGKGKKIASLTRKALSSKDARGIKGGVKGNVKV